MGSEPSGTNTEDGFTEYCSQCSFDGDGTIYDSDGIAVWKYKAQAKKGFVRTLLEGPAGFSFRDLAEREILSIICDRRYPFARFSILENNSPIGEVEQSSLLFNKYSIYFKNDGYFNFDMPLFSVRYHGTFGDGRKLHVRFFRHDTWYFKIPSDLNRLELIAILGFLHRERQRT